MRHQTEKQAAAFKVKVVKALQTLPVFPCGGSYEFRLETRHGLLRLAPGENSIRTRFDDIPASAPAGAPLNPYSGKWNFEFGFKPAQVELDWAIECIRRVLTVGASRVHDTHNL